MQSVSRSDFLSIPSRMSKAAAKHQGSNTQENLFDFSEIIQFDQVTQGRIWGQIENVNGSIEIAEGTGGSGTSEITQNLYNIMQSRNCDVINIVQEQNMQSVDNHDLQGDNKSLDIQRQVPRRTADNEGPKESSSQFGCSSSHMSYQFLPSNQQVSFANTNSGSKKTSEAQVHTKSSAAKDKSSTIISNFIPGTEQTAPDAIHIDRPVKIDMKKQRGLGQIHAFERPPSCGSFK
jgi:hypothetical protein